MMNINDFKIKFDINNMLKVDSNNKTPTSIAIIDREDEQQMLACDFQFQENKLKQPYKIINRNGLVLMFIIMLILISYQTFSIYLDLPSYYQEYLTFIKQEQIQSQSHKKMKFHFNPIEQKMESMLEKIQKLQQKLILVKNKNEVKRKNADKSLHSIKNIKKNIKKIISKTIIEQKSEKNEEVLAKKHIFNIPKYIWTYKQTHQTYIDQLSHQNFKYYGKMNNYQLKSINQSNYINYLSLQTNHELNTALREIQAINDRIPSANRLKKYLILYNLLYKFGGIMIDGPFTFSEDLQWISNISSNIIKMRGNQGITPEIIAFYIPQKGGKAKYNIEPSVGIEQIDKNIIEIPAIQQFFMASIQKSEFLGLLINKLYSILSNFEFLEEEKALFNLSYDKNVQFPKMMIYTASQIVLKQKQKQIDELTLNSYKRFAFDYFGIAFINANFGPYKLDMLYNNFWPAMVPQISYHSSYFDLARYKYQDFLEYSGPIKYLCRLNNLDKMEFYLNKSMHGEDIQIYEGSLIQRLLYPSSSHHFIIPNPEKSFTDTKNDIWTGLPKIIWVFWANGIVNSSPFHQMCFNSIKKTANRTGFQVIQINDNNINKYIPQTQLDRIHNAFLNAKAFVRIQSISDAYRLEVLYRHGGIYFDITSVGIDNYDWILDIGRLPSQFIFNRFGNTPKVLMSHHPYDGQPGTWSNVQLNINRSVKAQWHLALQNSWIAAERSSQFIKQWKDLFLQFIVSPYEKIEQIFVQSGVSETKWTLRDNHYLLAMDAAKSVLGRRQRMIQKEANSNWKNSADYYKLWSFNAYLAPTKMRSNLNYDDPGQKVNAYLFQYPLEYVEEIIGKPRYFIKFFGYEVEEISKFISNHPNGNMAKDIHSRSFFNQYLWDDKFTLLIANENKLINKLK